MLLQSSPPVVWRQNVSKSMRFFLTCQMAALINFLLVNSTSLVLEYIAPEAIWLSWPASGFVYDWKVTLCGWPFSLHFCGFHAMARMFSRVRLDVCTRILWQHWFFCLGRGSSHNQNTLGLFVNMTSRAKTWNLFYANYSKHQEVNQNTVDAFILFKQSNQSFNCLCYIYCL